MERDKTSTFYGTKSDLRRVVSRLQIEETRAADEQRADAKQLFAGLQRLSSMSKKLHKMIAEDREDRRYGETDEVYGRRLRQLLLKTEKDITSFKEEQRVEYDELWRQNEVLTRELELLDQRFQAWATTGTRKGRTSTTTPSFSSSSSSSSSSASSSASSRFTSVGRKAAPATRKVKGRTLANIAGSGNGSHLHRQIQQLDAEIAARGGQEGGWDTRDHAKFLRILSRVGLRRVIGGVNVGAEKTKGAPETLGARMNALIEAALTALPHFDASAIREHYDWFQWKVGTEEQKKRCKSFDVFSHSRAGRQ